MSLKSLAYVGQVIFDDQKDLFFRRRTDSGTTPLHLAASEGLLDCVEALVRAGADVSARDKTGNTPLDSARVGGHREVAR